VLICRCEEVTRREIEQAVAAGGTSLAGVKIRTHAGMGLCQGRTCRRLIAQIIAAGTGKKPEDIEPFTVRAPVRTARIEEFLSPEES
jgi:NAD(P)H-nitrite reductase large subunit